MAKNNGSSLTKWIVILLILGGLGAGGWWYWKHNGEKPVEYKTAAVSLGDLIQVVTATGQLNPRTNVQVGSQVSGIINKLYVDFNSTVTNGQVIAQLDPATYKALVAQAKADLANSEAALELARVQAERSNILYTNHIVAKSDDDSAVAGLHQAQAMVMMKQAALDQAQANLEFTTIYAPVNGIVISRNVDVGQTVAASMSAPILYMIANDLAQMQIDALISEADIGGVETNQQVNFSVDAFPTRVFQGTVVQIRNAPQTNQNVITYDTVIGVDNSDLKLRPGMTASVSVITAQKSGALRIPNATLRFHPQEAADAKKDSGTNLAGMGGARGAGGQSPGNGKDAGGRGGGPGGPAAPGNGKPRGDRPTHTVYVLAKGPEGQQIAKPVQIKTGISDGVYTQVLDGLKEGDEVVVSQTLTEAQQAAQSNPFGGGGRRF